MIPRKVQKMVGLTTKCRACDAPIPLQPAEVAEDRDAGLCMDCICKTERALLTASQKRDLDRGIFYEDGGQPTREYAPAPLDLLEDVLLDLQDTGAKFPNRPAALTVLDKRAKDLGHQYAAEALHRICSKLEGTTAAAALRRVLIGTEGHSLRLAAKEVGVTHGAVRKQEDKIAEKLGVPPPESSEAI